MQKRPDILYIMCDQLRYDCIAALGNDIIHTPNLDRLARRGALFTNAYSTCPVCVPARYTIMTGREPHNTGCYSNEVPSPLDGLPADMEERCGPYLARSLKKAGYRTFGVGKFHTCPDTFEDLGFETHIHTEELYGSTEQRGKDGYASFIRDKHPEYDFIEQLHGERTDMYYMPQTSPLPAELTVENYAAEKAVELISAEDGLLRPYFGFVSFIGPHPPFAPPIPYNRMYNPDKMPNPVRGELCCDHMDEQIPWMNYLIWANELNDFSAREAKARYYGEISYIDACLGKILDCVEARGNSDNTLICFFTDHGDMTGDHSAWQKECYFEQSCHIPFFVSWPDKIAADTRKASIAALSDLFGIAASAAQVADFRDGADILGNITGNAPARQHLFSCYMRPGTQYFKLMVRNENYKYIYMANGGREQLFDLEKDKNELENLAEKQPDTAAGYRAYASDYCRRKGLFAALDDNGKLKSFEFAERALFRIHQFDGSRGVYDFTVK
ncbi:MAG: sulfatase-like hydrolase/transferase [Oscillospiraceae bacterium]|nr:sulfatase-like hydrolase/transferase [Oscillospiraceae bacterium]